MSSMIIHKGGTKMIRKVTILSAVAAIVFDLIACLGDSNLTVYNVFMGLCCAAFLVLVYGLFRIEFSKKDYDDISVRDDISVKKAA